MSKLFYPKRRTLITPLGISVIENCNNFKIIMDANF